MVDIDSRTPTEMAELRKASMEKQKRAREAAQPMLERYKKMDDDARIAARDVKPVISVIEGQTGRKFICGYGVEVGAEYISRITVKALGGDPEMVEYGGYISQFKSIGDNEPYVTPIPASDAVIEIELITGKTFTAKCNRHEVEAVYDAFLKAWRENR